MGQAQYGRWSAQYDLRLNCDVRQHYASRLQGVKAHLCGCWTALPDIASDPTSEPWSNPAIGDALPLFPWSHANVVMTITAMPTLAATAKRLIRAALLPAGGCGCESAIFRPFPGKVPDPHAGWRTWVSGTRPRRCKLRKGSRRFGCGKPGTQKPVKIDFSFDHTCAPLCGIPPFFLCSLKEDCTLGFTHKLEDRGYETKLSILEY